MRTTFEKKGIGVCFRAGNDLVWEEAGLDGHEYGKQAGLVMKKGACVYGDD